MVDGSPRAETLDSFDSFLKTILLNLQNDVLLRQCLQRKSRRAVIMLSVWKCFDKVSDQETRDDECNRRIVRQCSDQAGHAKANRKNQPGMVVSAQCFVCRAVEQFLMLPLVWILVAIGETHRDTNLVAPYRDGITSKTLFENSKAFL